MSRKLVDDRDKTVESGMVNWQKPKSISMVERNDLDTAESDNRRQVCLSVL